MLAHDEAERPPRIRAVRPRPGLGREGDGRTAPRDRRDRPPPLGDRSTPGLKCEIARRRPGTEPPGGVPPLRPPKWGTRRLFWRLGPLPGCNRGELRRARLGVVPRLAP